MGLERVDTAYPMTASHLRIPSLSEIHPENSLRMEATDSATPSISPMTAVLTPSTLFRNSGSRLTIISLDTSVKKLVTATTHTLRGSLVFFPLLSKMIFPFNREPLYNKSRFFENSNHI